MHESPELEVKEILEQPSENMNLRRRFPEYEWV